MTALAVDKHEDVVRRQAAHVRGPGNGRRVTDRLRVHVKRRNGGTQHVLDVGRRVLGEFRGPDHVDRHGRIRRGSIGPARTGCYDFFN